MRFVADGPGRLDRFLAERLPHHSRSKLQRLIEHGGVRVEGHVTEKSGFELRAGWEIELEEPGETPPHDLTPVDIPLCVRFEDAEVMVVDKPRGLTVHPAPSSHAPTLVHALLARQTALSTGSAPYRPGIVHRLDKDTTGLILVAKTDAAHASLAAQIAEKSVLRVYVAWVYGQPDKDEFTIEAPVGRHPAHPLRMAVKKSGKPAVTHVRVIRHGSERSLVTCRLETGRTHQIRVHLDACGLPVVGDPTYGPKRDDGPLQLHAALVSFTHPSTHQRVTVYAEPPADFLEHETVDKEEVEKWTL